MPAEVRNCEVEILEMVCAPIPFTARPAIEM